MLVSLTLLYDFGHSNYSSSVGAAPMKTMFKLVSIFAVFALLQTASLPAQEETAAKPAKTQDNSSKDPLENLKFRNLGPAVGGGRVAAVVGIPGKPNVYYAGAAGGGVWMTQDGGLSWKAVFEKESTASIGAIALAPSNPNLVWVGTGEKNIRNDVITGKGIFFSPDAGATWKHMGLRDAGQISNIAIDLRDPNTFFVCLLCHVLAPNC